MNKAKIQKAENQGLDFPISTFNQIKSADGFTLIELLVSTAIFAMLTVAVIGTLAAVGRTTKISREKTTISSLATNYLEIVRNLPYSQAGSINGNPPGPLPDLNNAFSQIIGGTTYKIYYEVTYIDDPADGTALAGTDPYSADYKQVKMDILNTTTGQVVSFITNVVPKGLEGTISEGALRVQVLDSQGNPVSGASLHITYPTTTPTIILDRQTDANGLWVEVGLPPAVNNYRVVATKTGYNSDQTYPVTVQNPNPIHPDPTIAAGVVTKFSLNIDPTANLTIKTLDQVCQPLSGVNLNVLGAKLIGTNPNVNKYNNNYASVSGSIVLNNLESDTYTPTLLTGQSYIVYGTSPIQKIVVLPGTTQTFSMILGPNSTPNSLLVVVKDAASGTALEGATVELQKGGAVPQDYFATTGGSVWVQSDWSDGAGQAQWSPASKDRYFQDDGNIDSNSAPTGLRLKKTAGHYPASGWAESSTFDTGTSATNYTIISWQPSSQSAGTVLKFQVAANNDNATWNYVGPDGLASSYFTTPGTDMGSSLDGKRYVRYKAYLSTTDNNKTPVLTSTNLNFVTGCFTPGQSIFPDLTAGNNYNLIVSVPGYTQQTIFSLNINGNQLLEVLMSP